MSNSRKVVDFRRRESESQVLERLFNEHGDALRSFLRARMGEYPEQEIEDIAQEVFLRLSRMENLYEKVAQECKNSRAYIFTTANHLLVDRIRHNEVVRRHRKLETEMAEDKGAGAGPEKIVEGQQQLEVVERTLMGLPPLWRKAFVLNRFKHMTYREIAQEMSVSPRTVEKYIARSLEKIRNAVIKLTGEKL